MRSFLFILIFLLTSSTFASDIWERGSTVGGILDFREVMPGLLYRGGAGSDRQPLDRAQLGFLCEKGVGHAFYVYPQGFRGASETSCGSNTILYQQKSWDRPNMVDIHRAIYDSVKSDQRPVFVHCWYGIHATGLVAATALMQFCGVSAAKAVEYWKVGIVPKLQYPHVIEKIRNFRPNPALQLTESEQSQFCPQM